MLTIDKQMAPFKSAAEEDFWNARTIGFRQQIQKLELYYMFPFYTLGVKVLIEHMK